MGDTAAWRHAIRSELPSRRPREKAPAGVLRLRHIPRYPLWPGGVDIWKCMIEIDRIVAHAWFQGVDEQRDVAGHA